MRILRGVAALMLAALFVIWMGGCKPVTPPAQPQRLVVGFVGQLSESSWRDRIASSVMEAAQIRGIQLIELSTARTQDAQIQAVRSLITYQVDAIVLSPMVMRGWDNVLREAKEAGIPILLIHRHVQSDEPDAIGAYVGSYYEGQGRTAAQYICERFANQEKPVRVMEIHGVVGSSDTAERSRGIRDTFGTDGKFDIFYSISCGGMYSKAYEMMDIYLNNSTQPDVLISFSDSMTLGAIEAMKDHGIRPGRDIVIVSFDGQQDAVDLLKEGDINCIVETDPNIGSLVMDAAISLIDGGEMGREIVLDDHAFYDTDDLSGLAQRGY